MSLGSGLSGPVINAEDLVVLLFLFLLLLLRDLEDMVSRRGKESIDRINAAVNLTNVSVAGIIANKNLVRDDQIASVAIGPSDNKSS